MKPCVPDAPVPRHQTQSSTPPPRVLSQQGITRGLRAFCLCSVLRALPRGNRDFRNVQMAAAPESLWRGLWQQLIGDLWESILPSHIPTSYCSCCSWSWISHTLSVLRIHGCGKVLIESSITREASWCRDYFKRIASHFKPEFHKAFKAQQRIKLQCKRGNAMHPQLKNTEAENIKNVKALEPFAYKWCNSSLC